MSGTRFRDLHVWQKAKALAVQVYEVAKKGPLSSDFVMRDQMRRSAISICSNIAEGNERNTDRDNLRFLYIAKGSAAELITQLEIAEAVGLMTSEQTAVIGDAAEEVARMLGGLIKAREQ
jgi:four helix bundle protein